MRLAWMIPLGLLCCEVGQPPCGEGMARTDQGECVDVSLGDTQSETGTDSGKRDTSPAEDSGGPSEEVVVQVYLLGGQSNMDGGGLMTALPPRLQVAQDDVALFWSGWWQWRGLAPASYWSSQFFGPEVTFGRTLADANPDQPIALIKHAIGGTDLAECWYPGETKGDAKAGDCYAGFLATVEAAIEELDKSQVAWEIAGMGWMQGEADGGNASWAQDYETNLLNFIRRLREDVGEAEMPFAMGRVDCKVHCPHRETIRAAQDAVAAVMDGVGIVETEDLPQVADSLHFDGSGMRTLGERLAGVLLGAQQEVETPRPAGEIVGTYQSNYTGDFVVGYLFETTRNIVVTDLGTLDIGWDGLMDGADVAIWEETSSNMVARATVPAARSAESSIWGGWRFVGIEPVVLKPGRYVIGSQVYGNSSDRYIHNAEVRFQEGIRWLEARHAGGATLQLPKTISYAESSWFGPNFLFGPVPKNTDPPSTLQ